MRPGEHSGAASLAADLLLHALNGNYDAVVELVGADPTGAAMALINTMVALGQLREAEPGDYKRSLEYLALEYDAERALWQVTV